MSKFVRGVFADFLMFKPSRSVLCAVICLLGVGVTPLASAVPTVIYDATQFPEDAGWIRTGTTGIPTTNGSVSVSLNSGGTIGGLLDVNTSGGTIGYATNYYLRDMGTSAFVISMRVAVVEASHNFADAGFYFSGIYIALAGSPDRANSIYIDPDEIGFMNSGLTADQTFAYSLDATVFHEYAIRYSTTHLMEVFVDATFEDVLNGSATAVLSRQMYADRDYPGFGDALNDWANYQVGVVSFGDMSNDYSPGVNSRYTLDFVKYQNLGLLDPRPIPTAPAVVPEPASLALLAIGLAALGAARRRKQQATA